MDPLSIASSSAGLAGACIKVTKWLYEVIEETKRADTTLTELCSEVTILQGVLASLDSTIRGCTSQPQVLSYIDNDIWLKIDSQVTECSTTLALLEVLLEQIQESSKGRLFKRANIQARLTYYARDIKGHKDMVQTHYCAIQMALGTLNVSICVRTTTSQDRMFLELKELRKVVDVALTTPTKSGVATDPRVSQLALGLHSMAKSVQSFHATASTMASSVSGSSRWGGSVVGELPSMKRNYIYEWQNYMTSLPEESSTGSSAEEFWSHPGDGSTVLTTPTPAPEQGVADPLGEDRDVAYDSDLELEISENLAQLAKEQYHHKKYEEAEQYLRKRLSKIPAANLTALTDTRLQIACCELLQSRWDPASATLAILARDAPMETPGLPTLLHAVAIGHMSTGRHAEAQRFCKLGLQRRRKVSGKASAEYAHGLTLLVAIANSSGDMMEGHALMRAMPAEYRRQEVLANKDITGLDFLSGSSEMKKLLLELWGQSPRLAIPETRTPTPPPSVPPASSGVTAPYALDADACTGIVPRLFSHGSRTSLTHRSPYIPEQSRSWLLPPIRPDNPLARKPTTAAAAKKFFAEYNEFASLPTLSASVASYYHTVYNIVNNERLTDSVSPRARESETDTDKELVSGLYVYVKSQGSDAPTATLSPSVAVLGPHGRLTCTRDWNLPGLQVTLKVGGSTSTVDISQMIDIIEIIQCAVYLEHCDWLRPRINLEASMVGIRGPENPTDTYKEVCFSSFAPDGYEDVGLDRYPTGYLRDHHRMASQSGALAKHSSTRVATFEEMGIPEGKSDQDCIVM